MGLTNIQWCDHTFNPWVGVTTEDQEAADNRISYLVTIPAHVRFLSCEPLLGPINLDCYGGDVGPDGINWVICGGESGSHARPMQPEWARSLRDQCASANTPQADCLTAWSTTNSRT